MYFLMEAHQTHSAKKNHGQILQDFIMASLEYKKALLETLQEIKISLNKYICVEEGEITIYHSALKPLST